MNVDLSHFTAFGLEGSCADRDADVEAATLTLPALARVSRSRTAGSNIRIVKSAERKPGPLNVAVAAEAPRPLTLTF